MEKLKLQVFDRVKIISTYQGDKNIGQIGVISKLFNNGRVHVKLDKDGSNYSMFIDGLELLKQHTTESRSKQISQSLKHICTKGLVIKSEDIIAKVKESIGTEYVFGGTILRALRHLRQDGILDYTADKHTREYTFR